MKRIYNKEFSLVELLCIIVIVGILITMGIIIVNQTLLSNKENNLSFQEKSLRNITKKYIKDNTDKLPKYVGESVNISLNELKKNNYLKKDIYNKKTCMDKSYVRVYKYDNDKYSYLPLISCDEKEESIPKPIVKALFIDGNNNLNNNLIFNSANETRLYIEITGGTTKGRNKIEINNYQISISIKTKDDDTLYEEYNSDLVYTNKEELIIDKKLSDYIDFSNATYISVKVISSNILGGVKEVTNIVETNS